MSQASVMPLIVVANVVTSATVWSLARALAMNARSVSDEALVSSARNVV